MKSPDRLPGSCWLSLFLAAFLALCVGGPSAFAKPPNFVIIFTDDQGYGDLGCYGGKHVSTPRIDEMAAEGSRLTSFYVAAPVCTPSRAALMTGCYPKRIDMATGSDFAVLLDADPKGLHPDEITIAEVLKGAGYRTGMFGKWHLGDQPEFLPTRQGFDEFFGIPYSHDIHPFHPAEKWSFPPLALLDQEEVIEMDPDADYLTKRFTERAVEFIRKNSEEPFFVYLPHPIPHKPLHVSPPFMKGVDPAIVEALGKEEGNVDYRTRDKLFRQAMSEIDWSVGRILDTLEEEGVDEDTLVIFFSDNGPAIGSAGPLKGRKGSTFEGGMREPTVIRWPGRIPAGKDNDQLMTAMDLLPTFARLAGAELPTDRVIDGKDVWPVLAGEADSPHDAFFYHGGNTLRAVRSGDWKLHLKGDRPVALHDLARDIGEKKNVLADNGKVADQLLEKAAAFQKDLAANSRPAAWVENPVPLGMASVENAIPPDQPNFIVIFADDLGYGDISAYRSTATQTPHIDALAAEGFRSLDFFVPANVCSPSRASLLTGRYPMRCGMPVARNEGHPKYRNYGLASEEFTIPELLKAAGYRSLIVGKWHLGMEIEGSHPLDAGFDEHLGIPSNYEAKRGKSHKVLYRGREVEAENVPFQVLTKRYTDEAVAFIERQREKPFFLFFSHHIPHTPHLPSKPFAGSSGKGKYGDVIRELDESVGRIMEALREAGVDEKTLVVFTSDNGPGRAGSAAGLRGGKFGTMEGGHRVPGIFRWPGQIPPGQISGATLTSMDLLPLFCGLADVDLPKGRMIDGKDIFAILQGKETESPHKVLAYYNGTNLQAVREGRWKLHLARTVEDQPFWNRKKAPGKIFVNLEQHALFDLKGDVGESRNVADRHPEVVERLLERARSLRAELGDVRVTGSDQRAIRLKDPQVR